MSEVGCRKSEKIPIHLFTLHYYLLLQLQGRGCPAREQHKVTSCRGRPSKTLSRCFPWGGRTALCFLISSARLHLPPEAPCFFAHGVPHRKSKRYIRIFVVRKICRQLVGDDAHGVPQQGTCEAQKKVRAQRSERGMGGRIMTLFFAFPLFRFKL